VIAGFSQMHSRANYRNITALAAGAGEQKVR
jgi:hypothetical protein